MTHTILDAIGNTPIVKLNKVVPENAASVYVKLEYFNPTGSYKDRMALAMIEGAEKRGELRPGMTVVEYTGGSTGSSLAFVCAVKGYPLKIVSSDAFSVEKLRTMRAFGAELTIVPSENGKITPDLIPRMIEIARQMAEELNTYWTNQFYNTDSPVGYSGIGREFLNQIDGEVHAFCGGVGTAGMVVGVASVLRTRSPKTQITLLEPATSPLISKGVAGAHHVEGIGTGFVPPLLKTDYYDQAIAIDEGEARQMVRRLAREEGIFAGTSSGLNVTAAVKIAQELGPGHNVVTVAVDSGLKYLAGDLYSDES
jgi:cysteine synthase